MYRNFGCEFEFSTEYLDMLKIIKPIIFKIYGSNCLKSKNDWYKSHNNFKRWHLKVDSTTLSELCTPVSTLDNIDRITMVMEEIGKDKNVKITHNDSFHVHMDVGEAQRESILILWMRFEKLIFSLFPPHRQNNRQYCFRSIPNKSSQKDVLQYLKKSIEITQQHHSAISFFFYKRHIKSKRVVRNTVEFRLGEGTVDPKLIKNWILFLHYFLDYCSNIEIPEAINILCDTVLDKNMDNLKLMIKELKIKDSDLKKWLINRFKKYAIVKERI